MAFFPISMFDPMLAVERSLRQLQHDMGNMVIPSANQVQAQAGYYRPWRHIPGQKSGTSNVHFDKDHFQIDLDIQQFSPNEITVKTVGNHIVVEGKHEEKEDEHGFISRHFIRRYGIPKGVQAEAITSSLSSDGLLTITAPTVQPVKGGSERTIPIASTGVPVNKQVTNK